MTDFISFIRFLMFKGELKVLHANAIYDAHKAKKKKLNVYENPAKRKKELLEGSFKGHMKMTTKRHECAVWNFIYKICKNALKAYPTTSE